jgi:hypothetical protein
LRAEAAASAAQMASKCPKLSANGRSNVRQTSPRQFQGDHSIAAHAMQTLLSQPLAV